MLVLVLVRRWAISGVKIRGKVPSAHGAFLKIARDAPRAKLSQLQEAPMDGMWALVPGSWISSIGSCLLHKWLV